jgi:glucose/arabinose dehydrogenase/mono/diheme cytochrome c family protein
MSFLSFRAWRPFLCGLAVGCTTDTGSAAPEAAQLKRGQNLFIGHCSMCHQVTGRGAAGVYPPLGGSDYLAGPNGREQAIRAVVGGLRGPVTVNGKTYENQMPAIVLNDTQAADVLTYVFNSWGNPGGEFTAAEVATQRRTTDFKTYEDLVKANAYSPLPQATGFSVRELIKLPDFAVRLASDGRGEKLYVLHQSGDVSRIDLGTGKLTNVFRATDYMDPALGNPGPLGLMLDGKNRLWIVNNQRHEGGQPYVTNEVTIFRTTGVSPKGDPIQARAWLRTRYPWGIGPYNHGVSHLALGRDGFLYVSSGSRTDGGEKGNDPQLGTMGETELTAALWRVDPESPSPKIEVVARGIRNAWSFAWNGDGDLFTVSNGPDAHAGEEMDHIVPPPPGGTPRHHGFPYQFENWPLGRKAYPHTPDAPADLSPVHPVKNLGPDGWATGFPGWTFHPHSSPAGLVWLDSHWPAPWGNGFLMGRFGNLITAQGNEDVGFDILSVHPTRETDGSWSAPVKTFLAPLGRPIDLHLAGGKLYVLEYTRPTNFKEGRGWLPGRILELTPKK